MLSFTYFFTVVFFKVAKLVYLRKEYKKIVINCTIYVGKHFLCLREKQLLIF